MSLQQASIDMEKLRSNRAMHPINSMARRDLSEVMTIFEHEFPSFGAIVATNTGDRFSCGLIGARVVGAEYVQFALSRPDGELVTMWRDYSDRRFWQINYLRQHDRVAIVTFQRAKRCVMADNGRIDQLLGYLARAPI